MIRRMVFVFVIREGSQCLMSQSSERKPAKRSLAADCQRANLAARSAAGAQGRRVRYVVSQCRAAKQSLNSNFETTPRPRGSRSERCWTNSTGGRKSVATICTIAALRRGSSSARRLAARKRSLFDLAHATSHGGRRIDQQERVAIAPARPAPSEVRWALGAGV